IVPWRKGGRRLIIYYKMLLRGLSKHFGVDLAVPWKDIPEKVRKALLYGVEEEIEFTHWRKGAWRKMAKKFEGVIPNLERLYVESESEFTKSRLQHYMVGMACPDCKGARLKPESLAVTLADKSIIAATQLSIHDAIKFFGSLSLSDVQRQIAA